MKQKRLIRKAILMIAIELISLVLIGGLLVQMQTKLSVDEQKRNTKVKLEEMEGIVANGAKSEEETIQSFDEVYKSKADSLSFMYKNEVLSGYTEANMQEAKALLDVDNVLVIDSEGKVLAQAEETKADFTLDRYNQLREAFATEKASDGFEVQIGDEKTRYYGSMIDKEAMVVLEQNPEELYALLDNSSTWKSMLSHVTVGHEGYAIAISAKDYTFLYHPDEEMIGQDAIASGITVEDLEDENYDWLTIDGERLYCGVKKVEDAYVLCAVTEKEITSSRNTTVAMILFACFMVMTLVNTYALFMKRKTEEDNKKSLSKNYVYNKTVASKIAPVAIFGLVFILFVSLYMQTLFSLSRQSMSNTQHVTDIEKSLKQMETEKEDMTELYNSRYLNKAQVAAYIIENQPGLANRDSLAELSNILGVESINIFDDKGTQTATNTSFIKFELSQDPKSQSYEFNKLLLGMEYLIQDAQPDEVSGKYHQYIGAAIHNEEGYANGFAQIGVTPEKLEELLSNMDIGTIMRNYKVGKGGIVFAVDKEKNEFVYYPEDKMIGRSAVKSGMKKAQFTDEYTGYLTIGGEKYYASSVETADYYLYSAVPSRAIAGNRGPVTIATGIATLISLAIMFSLLTIQRTVEGEEAEETEDHIHDVNFDISMPDGRKKRTTSAVSRWSLDAIHWSDKTAEQQLFLMLKGLLGFLAVIICLAVLMKDRIFDANSIFTYIISGKWSRGVNIFSFTGSILVICVATVITMIVQKILTTLSRTFGAKGETICRMLRSFVKYFSGIAILYYCLSLFGIDTKTLLASAGILSLVVGLGAQTLVSDILAGLFIIFEGEFQVGDIVEIGGYRGTVMEIGIRTTKVQDGNQNVKIISNSDVCGVINTTKDYSYSWTDVGIEYGESLERVESILQDEFPHIKERHPNIIEGPFYKGVVALADNSVILRVMVLCAEGDRGQLERDLNRELKLLFDRHEINMPFPQIVINKPTEFKEATENQKRKAEEFNKEQKELLGNLSIEEDEEDR